MTEKDIGTQLDRMARKVSGKIWQYIANLSVSRHLEYEDLVQEAILRYLTWHGQEIPEDRNLFHFRMYQCALRTAEKELRRSKLATFIEYLEEDDE